MQASTTTFSHPPAAQVQRQVHTHNSLPMAARFRIGLLRCIMLSIWFMPTDPCLAQAKGTIFLDFLDEAKTDELLPCRVEILDARGRPVRGRGVLYQSGWNLVDGTLQLRGRPGDYTFRAFHGPQFAAGTGGFTLDRNASGQDTVALKRYSRLEDEGWFGGDLMSYVTSEETLRWLAAEDLAMGVVVSDRFPEENTTDIKADDEPADPRKIDGNGKWVDRLSFHDTRPGSGLTLHHWMPPAEVPAWLASSRLIAMAGRSTADISQLPPHIEIQRPWARDVPVWLASQKIDSIQLLGPHISPDSRFGHFEEPLEIPEGDFRGRMRPGKMVERIYWETLEAGFRIPPSAGSGFGKDELPLGSHRVYTSAEALFSSGQRAGVDRAAWWQALRQGRCFVTSGPLLRATINGQLPGSILQNEDGQPLKLDVAVKLTVADPVEYLDVIFNKRTLYQARLDEYARQGGRIPPLSVDQSGWLVIRVVTEHQDDYRIATTAPFYIEWDGQSRISRRAVEYFRKWLAKSTAQVSQLDEKSQTSAAPFLEAAQLLAETSTVFQRRVIAWIGCDGLPHSDLHKETRS